MNPAQQELLDLAILRVLDGNRTRYGLNAAAIGHLLAQFGFTAVKADVLLDRLDYLTGKSLVEEVLKQIDRANRAWRISEAGIAHVDQRT